MVRDDTNDTDENDSEQDRDPEQLTQESQQDGQHQQGGQSRQVGQPQQGGQSRQGGQRSGGQQRPDSHQQAEQQTSTGLSQNQSAALSYLFSWVGGLVFYILEENDEYIRFHAVQSILLGAAFTGSYIALSLIGDILSFLGPLSFLAVFTDILSILLSLGMLGVTIVMILKATDGEWYKLPVVGDIAMSKSQPSPSPGGQQQGGQNR